MKSIFALVFGSFLPCGLRPYSEWFQNMEDLPVIKISPIISDTHETLHRLAFATHKVAKLSGNIFVVREQIT